MPVSPVPIAFCITELNFGGAERMLVELVTRLDRSRFEPKVYSLAPRPIGPDTVLSERLEAAGISVTFLGGSSLRHAPRILRRLEQQFRAQRPALLQTFLWHANTLGTLAGRRAGIRHIVTGVRVAERRQNLHRWIARRTAPLVERHVCVSREVAEFSIRQVGLPAERVVVIPNGVDLEQYPATPLPLAEVGLPPGRRAILFVGRLSPQKRVAWLLAQAIEILRQLPEHDLLIVGRGRQRPQLEALARESELPDRIHFLGWRSDVPALLAASDVLVLSSLAEGMPNVVLEAMASGKPAVATRAEGVEQLLGPASRQQSVPQGDARAFVEQVVAIARDPALAEQLGTANRRRAAAEFSLEKMVCRYEQLYDSLLGRT